jgi:Cu/Ag efflux protein CusF
MNTITILKSMKIRSVFVSLLSCTLTLALLSGPAVSAPHAGHAGHGNTAAHGATVGKPGSPRIYTTNGTVEAVNQAGNKVTISHGPVPDLGWPAMTMGFTAETPSLLKGLRKGDKVRIDFRQEGNVFIILDLEPLT